MTQPFTFHISGGWIRIYRQALENGWLRNHRLWAFWCYCLLKASHKSTKVMIGYQQVSLESGQFVFGRQQAAADLDLSENVIRTCLTRLISTNNLTIKTTNKYSIITIVNWHSYQNGQEENHQQNHQQLNQEVTSKSPTSHHIQEVKTLKKETFSPESLRLSGLLADLILKNNPDHSRLSNGGRDSTVNRWAVDIDKLIRIDRQTPEMVEKVLRWSQADSFWQANILSGSKLREQWDRLKVQMQNDGTDRINQRKPDGNNTNVHSPVTAAESAKLRKAMEKYD